jgi:exodeoxyribonuclease VII small subunit
MERKKRLVNFEQKLTDLEALIESLENGDLTLDESLESFTQGLELARQCQAALKQAKQDVDVLTRKGDKLISEPFDELDH